MVALSKKICLLGSFSVGKTSLIRRFVYNRFDEKYMSTIGVNVSRKTISVPDKDQLVSLTVMVWDLAGGEEFATVRPSYLRGAAGAIVVCDLTRAETLAGLRQYVDSLWQVNPAARVLLAANKHDLTGQLQATESQVQAAATLLNIPYYLTSAKTGDEVDKLFRHLGQLLI